MSSGRETPHGGRRRLHRALFELHARLRTGGNSPGRQAGSIGLGTLIGCLPLYGLHLPLCLLGAQLFRLSRVTTYLAANINNPFTAPFLLAVEVCVGHLLLEGSLPRLKGLEARTALLELGGALAVGSVVVGLALGLVFAILAHRLARRWQAPSHRRRLIERVADRYRECGVFAWEFVRAKLRHDPIYLELLASGRLPDRGRLLDLGCGRGILIALLETASEMRDEGEWDASRPLPPRELEMTGVESRPAIASEARAAVRVSRIEIADLAGYEPPAASAILLLDVLHYLGAEEQEALVGRVGFALEPGGALWIRDADTRPRWRFLLTAGAERLSAIARAEGARRLHFRSSAEWCMLLARSGLVTRVSPMRRGTPYSNVLIEARRSVTGDEAQRTPTDPLSPSRSVAGRPGPIAGIM